MFKRIGYFSASVMGLLLLSCAWGQQTDTSQSDSGKTADPPTTEQMRGLGGIIPDKVKQFWNTLTPQGNTASPSSPEQTTEQTSEQSLDLLRKKRAELGAWRDRLIAEEEALTQAQKPATDEQNAQLKQLDQELRDAYRSAEIAKQQLTHLAALKESLAKAEALAVDSQAIKMNIQAAVTKRALNVRAKPSIESEAISNISQQSAVIVLGQYADTGWLLIATPEQFGFVRQTEIDPLWQEGVSNDQ